MGREGTSYLIKVIIYTLARLGTYPELPSLPPTELSYLNLTTSLTTSPMSYDMIPKLAILGLELYERQRINVKAVCNLLLILLNV